MAEQPSAAGAQQYDLVVIGAGPGGYVAAIRAAQLGMKVACVEKEYLGGTCLNVGCIPSKAMLDSSEKFHAAKTSFAKHGIKITGLQLDLAQMLARKNEVVKQLTTGVGGLFKKNKIDSVMGTGRVVSPTQVEVTASTGKQTLNTKRILIATGSVPIQIPTLPFDGKHILSSTEALALTEVPKKLVIVGAGYIGVEMGSIWARLGSEVVLVEFLDRALPNMDKELAGQLQRLLERQGLSFKFGIAAQSATVENGRVKLAWKSKDGTESGVEECDKIMVAIGRRPMTQGLGLEAAGVKMDAKGFIPVDHTTFQTNVPGVYAIGDVIGGLMLAHKAEEEGIACVERMNGIAGHVDYHTVPGVVYTHPELASVGYTEEEAVAKGHQVKVGKFGFIANGRAKAMDETAGQVKIIADAKTDRVLGVHILGAHASDMIAECVVAMEFKATAEDIARSNHAHPTMPEAIKEAAMAVDKRPIHI
ncbi:MAG: dihydrolipoyl dehydrogenase [Phycisphaerae bacterium]